MKGGTAQLLATIVLVTFKSMFSITQFPHIITLLQCNLTRTLLSPEM